MPPERAEAALETRPRTQQEALRTVEPPPDERLFVLPTQPADPDLYQAVIDLAYVRGDDPDSFDADRYARLLIAYHQRELAQLEAAWKVPSATRPPESPWLTKTEGARRVGMIGANGYPTDTFYNAIKRELGDVKRIHVDDVDRLVREGKL